MLSYPVGLVNSLKLGGAHMRRLIMAPLVRIMPCRLFGAKPLSEPAVVYFNALWINIHNIHTKSTWGSVCKMGPQWAKQSCNWTIALKGYIMTMSYFCDSAIKFALYDIWFPEWNRPWRLDDWLWCALLVSVLVVWRIYWLKLWWLQYCGEHDRIWKTEYWPTKVEYEVK